MYNLLVLGIIPGTQIQITFLIWIIGIAIVFAWFAIWRNHKMHYLRNYIITSYLLMRTYRITRSISTL